MSLDSLGRYAATHKPYDHIGNILPDIEYSEGQRPHGEFRPAPWLPVQFYDKHYENWMVITPGKVVAFDNLGYLVPAQYGLTGATITYTQNDVDAGVIDVRTGVTLLVGAIGTFNVSAVTDYMGLGYALAVSAWAGIAPYSYLQWAGDASEYDDGFNPVGYRYHNYNMQHRTAIVCDYVLELPLVPATTSSANVTQDSYADNVATMTALSNLPVAVNTVGRTPITFANGTLTDASTRFVNQVSALTDIASAGDWHIDYVTGVISVYATATLGGGNIYTVTYSNYASAPTGASVSKFACALGDLKPGNFVKCNADSNLVVATPSVVGANANGDSFVEIVGQILEVADVKGKDALDRVRSAYDSLATDSTGAYPAYAGQMDQMPGTANGGVPAKVHYAGAANLVVRVNLVSR